MAFVEEIPAEKRVNFVLFWDNPDVKLNLLIASFLKHVKLATVHIGCFKKHASLASEVLREYDTKVILNCEFDNDEYRLFAHNNHFKQVSKSIDNQDLVCLTTQYYTFNEGGDEGDLVKEFEQNNSQPMIVDNAPAPTHLNRELARAVQLEHEFYGAPNLPCIMTAVHFAEGEFGHTPDRIPHNYIVYKPSSIQFVNSKIVTATSSLLAHVKFELAELHKTAEQVANVVEKKEDEKANGIFGFGWFVAMYLALGVDDKALAAAASKLIFPYVARYAKNNPTLAVYLKSTTSMQAAAEAQNAILSSAFIALEVANSYFAERLYLQCFVACHPFISAFYEALQLMMQAVLKAPQINWEETHLTRNMYSDLYHAASNILWLVASKPHLLPPDFLKTAHDFLATNVARLPVDGRAKLPMTISTADEKDDEGAINASYPILTTNIPIDTDADNDPDTPIAMFLHGVAVVNENGKTKVVNGTLRTNKISGDAPNKLVELKASRPKFGIPSRTVVPVSGYGNVRPFYFKGALWFLAQSYEVDKLTKSFVLFSEKHPDEPVVLRQATFADKVDVKENATTLDAATLQENVLQGILAPFVMKGQVHMVVNLSPFTVARVDDLATGAWSIMSTSSAFDLADSDDNAFLLEVTTSPVRVDEDLLALVVRVTMSTGGAENNRFLFFSASTFAPKKLSQSWRLTKQPRELITSMTLIGDAVLITGVAGADATPFLANAKKQTISNIRPFIVSK